VPQIMKIQFPKSLCALVAVVALLGAEPASAQLFGGGQQQQQGGGMSAADAGLRMNRLEEQMRQMNGRNEELMHQIRQLQEQLKRLQGDIDFRLQDLEKGRGGGGQRRGDAGGGPAERTGQAATPAPSTDRGAGDMGGPAPGPRDLGQLPSGPTGQPITGQSGPVGGNGAGAPLVIAPEFGGPGEASAGADSNPATGGQSGQSGRDNRLTSAPSASADDEYALASGFLQRRDYEFAELQFKQFLDDHPSDRRAPDALYGLGESFYQRKQHSDAIEPFLTVVTKHGGSSRAPDSMLRLGQTLAAIDQREQACATLVEVGRKYPKSGAKTQADRERQRLGC
jgi:tol-pal system protein YbgF